MKKTHNVSLVPELAEPSKAYIPYSHAGLPVSPPKATQTPEEDSQNQQRKCDLMTAVTKPPLQL